MKSKFTFLNKIMALLGLLFVFQGSIANAQTVTYEIGTTGTQTNYYLPMYYLYGYNYTQTIYTAAEMQASNPGTDPKLVTKIFYKPTVSANTALWQDWKILMGNSNKTGFTNTTDWVPAAALEEVFMGQIPNNVVGNQWFEITLTTPFVWDGVSNIVIAVQEYTPSWTSPDPLWASYTLTPTSGQKGIYRYIDASPIEPTNPGTASGTSSTVAMIKLETETLDDCTGQVIAGAADVPNSSYCAQEVFTITVTGSSDPAVGQSYQWQSTPSGTGAWANIVGGTSLNYTEINHTAATDYRMIIHCVNSNTYDTTNVVTVEVNDPTTCYCEPMYTFGDYTSGFSTIGAIQDVDFVSGGTFNYQDLSGTDTIETYAGALVDFSHTYVGGSNTVVMWADWNQDGFFDNTTEKIAETYSSNATQTGVIEIPASVLPGEYRFRLRSSFSTTVPDPCNTVNYGSAIDYTIVIVQLNNCTGTPTAGVISAPDSLCPEDPFQILTTGQSAPADGLTFQWQSSPAGQNTWTDIVGADNIYINMTNGVSVDTDFRFIATCSHSSSADTSNVHTVNMNPPLDCYCEPVYSTGCTSGDRITNVTLAGETITLNNSTQCSPNGYGDYTNLANPDLVPGLTYTLSVTTDYGAPSSEQVKAWIDYNANGVFESTELIANTNGAGLGSGTATFDFTVPINAQPGVYTMRVRLVYGAAPIFDACDAQTWGETEDYKVSIISLSSCSTVPTPAGWATLASQDTLCVSGDVDLSVSEPVLGSDITYQFQQSTDNGATWTNVGAVLQLPTLQGINVTVPTLFRTQWLCNGVVTGTSATASVTPVTPELISTTDASRCGPGVVDLEAVVGAGLEARWYDSPTAAIPVYVGNTFTTPFLPNTTSYYVAASTPASPQPEVFIGSGNITMTSSPSPFYTTYEANKNQYLVLASEMTAAGYVAGPITDIAFDVIGATGPALENYVVKAGFTNLNTLSNTHVTGLTTVYEATGPLTLTANTEQVFPFSNPLVWDGVSNIVIETCFANSTWSSGHSVRGTNSLGFTASNYQYQDGNPNFCTSNTASIFTLTNRPNIKFFMLAGCESPREEVVATIDPSANIVGQVNPIICEGDVVPVNISTGAANYNHITYTTSGGDLYTNAAGTTPYVAGTHATTLYFKSDDYGPYQIYILGNNTTSDCNQVDTLDIFVQKINPEIYMISDTICEGDDLELTLLPLDGYAPNTIQWQSSTNGTTWTNITGANDNLLIVPNMTSDMYYRPVISKTGGTCSTTEQLIVVSDPQILAVFDGEVCGEGPVDLSATGSSGAQFAWYDDINSTVPVGFGQDFTTPSLNTTTSYYVSAYAGAVESPDEWVGSGSNTLSGTPNPFYTLYYGLKSQYIIRADELTALGYNPGQITEISYDVISNTGMAMSQFEIKMGLTTANVTTSTFDANVTSVYVASAPVTLTANTEKVFELDNPFFWDGTSNLVVEVCFNNSTWSSGHSVRGTSVGWNASVYYQADNMNVCSNTTGFTMTSRPNMKFKINSGCRSDKYEVIAHVRPEVTLNLPGTVEICTSIEHPGVLDAGAHPNNVSYLWDDNSTDRYRPITQSGTYYVTVTNEFGCEASDTIDATIKINPHVDLGSDTTVCIGGELILDAGPDGVVYSWNNGVNERYNSIVSPGTYTVLVEAANGCVVQDTIVVEFADQEVASISGISVQNLNPTTFNFSAMNATNVEEYLWQFGDGNMSNQPTPTHTYANGGNYIVIVEVGNICGIVSDTISVHVLSIGELDNGENLISIYPNPTDGKVMIENVSKSPMHQISIADATGRTLEKINTENQQEQFNKLIDLSRYADGMYWIHIHTEHGVYTKKVNLIK